MLYEIRHITTYHYETAAASARCALRLTPRVDKEQALLDHGLEITPYAQTSERVDFFGNRVVAARVEQPLRRLRVAALARVRVERAAQPAAALTPVWEDVRRMVEESQSLGSDSPVHGLYPTRLVRLDDAVTAYARESFPARRPILEAAADLMRRIRADFRYEPDATAVSTPLREAFERRVGVCQDFAHIMIAGLRGLGLSALYVSGYIRTIPPPGRPRLVGADASHAWVNVWCGPDWGWLGLDPTNAIPAGDDHIILAVGGDYADVSPVDGVFLGSGGQDLDVSVDVAPIADGAARET